MSAQDFDIVAIGEGMVEFNQTVQGEPRYLQGFGGDTSNAVIAAARAGARVAFVSAVGDDVFGQALLDLWRDEGVDCSGVQTLAGAPTGLYFVTHGPNGHAFSYRRTGSAAATFALNDAQRSVIARSRWLHLSGISLAISASARVACAEALRVAKTAGAQISFDSNLRLKLWRLAEAREHMLPLLAQCDLFLPSLDDIAALSGLSAPPALLNWSHELGATQVVLKLGARGCILSDSATGRQHLISPLPVRAIDATGAGDCFAGNLLARLASGDALLDAARYANAAASLAVQGHGAVAPMPRRSEVLEQFHRRSGDQE